MSYSFNKIIISYKSNNKNDELMLEFGIKNKDDKKEYKAREITIYSIQENKIKKDFSFKNKGNIHFVNKLTNSIETIYKTDFDEKTNSVIYFAINNKTHQIKFNTNVPNTHNYYFKILNPHKFVFEEVMFKDIDKYNDVYSKILSANNNYLSVDKFNFIKNEIYKNLDQLLLKEIENIGMLLHKYVYSVKNTEEFSELLKNTSFMYSPYQMFLKKLALSFLNQLGILDLEPNKTQLDEDIEKFINNKDNFEINKENFNLFKELFTNLKTENYKDYLNKFKPEIKNEILKQLEKILNLLDLKTIPEINKEEHNIAKNFIKNTNLYVLNFIPEKNNFPFIVEKNEENIKKLQKEKNIKEITINNKKFLTNITIDLIYSFNFNIDIKNSIKEIIDNNNLAISLYKEKFNFIKNNLLNMLYPHSALNFINLKTKVLPDVTKFNSKDLLSIDEIINDPIKIEHFKNSVYWGVIKYILDKDNIKIKEINSLEYLPESNQLKNDSIEIKEINRNNLGMKKFGYLPKILINTPERKKIFIEKIKNFNEFTDIDKLEKLVEEGEFIHTITETIREKEFFENKAVVCIFNKDGIPLAKLNLDIFQYLEFFEKNFKKINEIIPENKLDLNDKYKIVTNTFLKIKEFYANLLEDDVNKATNIANQFMIKNHNAISINPHFNETLKEKFLDLQIIFLKKLTEFNILDSNLKQIEDKIKISQINPIQKNKLLEYIKNVENIYFNLDKLNSELISLQKTNPELKEEIDILIESIIKEIVEIKKLVRKETRSFIFTVAILNNLIKIKKTNDEKNKIDILEHTFSLFKSWGLNAIGLSKEQFEDALNGILIQHKNNEKVINYFHDMGTGKTRLALFYSLLYSGLNPKHKTLFAIQNKNAQDIYEQLRDMLPSLTIFINQNFKNKNFANNVEYPFDILDYIDINLINPNFAEIFINGNKSKQEIIKEYPIILNVFLENYKNKNITELKDEINNLEINKFNIKISNLLQEIEKPIKDQLSRIDNTFKSNEFIKIKTIIYKNLIFATKFLNFLIQNNNIEINDSNKKKIEKKLLNLTKIVEEYILYLKQNQRANNIYLLSKNFINSLLKEETQTVHLKDINKKLSNLKTNNKIADIKLLKENYEYFSDENLIEFIIELYEKIDFTKMNNNFLYFINNIKEKKYLTAVIYRVLSSMNIDIETINLEPFIKIEEENIVFEKNDFIKNNSTSVEMKAIPSEHVLNILKNINNVLKDENLQKSIENKEIIQKMNAYLLASLYYNFQNQDILNRDKMEMLNKFIVSNNNDIEINIPFKQKKVYEFKYFLDYSDYSNYSVNTLKNPIFNEYLLEDDKIIEKNKVATFKEITLKLKKNKLEFFVSFNDKLNKKISINYGVSNYIFLKENTKFNIIIDEAHKSKKAKERIINDNVSVVQLTGTPINGTPESLANIDNPFLDKNAIKIKSKTLQLNGGISKIESTFVNLLLSLPLKLRKTIFIEYYKLILLNIENLDLKLLLIEGKILDLFKETEKINYETRKNIGIEVYEKFLTKNFEIRESIKELYRDLVNQENFELTDSVILDKLLKKSEIADMPGISNPQITKLLDSVSSIKTQDNRVYNFPTIQNMLKDGNTPSKELKDIKNYDFYKKTEIIELLEIYDNFKNLSKTKYLNTLKKCIRYFYLTFVEKSLKDKEKIFNDYKDAIEKELTEKVTITIKDFLKYLTPKTTTQSDTIDKYFEDAVYLNKQIDDDKIKALDVILNIIKIEKEKRLRILNNKYFISAIEELNSYKNIKNFKFEDSYKKVYLNEKLYKPYFKYNIKNIFPSILKEDTFLEFNFLNIQDKQNIKTLFKVYPIKSAEKFADKNLDENEGIILYTSKNKELIFATLMFLEHLYQQVKKDPLSKPQYILINIPNENIKKIFLNVDFEKLKKEKIYIKMTNPQKIYMDYNYSIPLTSKIAIIGNYTSLAEGYRFPKNPNIFFNSYPNNIATGLQASARAFFPGKVFKSNIYLGCSPVNIDFTYEIPNHRKEEFEKEFEDNVEFVLDLIKKFTKRTPSFKVSTKIESEEKKEQKKIAESFITSLNFIGATVEGYNKQIPNQIISAYSKYYLETIENKKTEESKEEIAKGVKRKI